jgi:hypothetical protein
MYAGPNDMPLCIFVNKNLSLAAIAGVVF